MMKLLFKKRCQILAMLLGVSVFILTACGSKEEVGVVKETIDVAMEDAVAEIADVEVEETAKDEVVSETIVEETLVKESGEELYIPEGIDIESTLPGEEWVASFAGNVNEPVVVIFNDNNERKEVVQADSEVIINPDEDRIALYWAEIGTSHLTKGISIKDNIAGDLYKIIIMDAEKMRSIPERPVEIIMENDSKEWFINFIIISE